MKVIKNIIKDLEAIERHSFNCLLSTNSVISPENTQGITEILGLDRSFSDLVHSLCFAFDEEHRQRRVKRLVEEFTAG